MMGFGETPNLGTNEPMLDPSTKHLTYTFPLDSITLKSTATGEYVEANIIQLTRWLAYWKVDRPWWNYRGPFINNVQSPEDSHWKWGSFVRRLRKNPWARCAAAQTSDRLIQGAIIYRRDGRSLLKADQGSVYIEYVAAAPCNRRDYAANPRYLGVGQGLVVLAIIHSHQWGLDGRVTLYSLPRASDFYKELGFVKTGDRDGRMIHYELAPQVAMSLLRDKGLV
jgi:hypothetical protein